MAARATARADAYGSSSCAANSTGSRRHIFFAFGARRTLRERGRDKERKRITIFPGAVTIAGLCETSSVRCLLYIYYCAFWPILVLVYMRGSLLSRECCRGRLRHKWIRFSRCALEVYDFRGLFKEAIFIQLITTFKSYRVILYF